MSRQLTVGVLGRRKKDKIPTDYILAYDMDGNVIDNSTKENDGILAGNYTFEIITDANGKTISGMTFNNARVETVKNLFATTDTNQISLSYFFKHSLSTDQIILELSTNYNSSNAIISLINAFLSNQIQFSVNLPADYDIYNSGLFNDNNWHHLAITNSRTIDNYVTDFYIDGVIQSKIIDRENKDFGNYNKLQKLYIGRRGTSVLPYYGSMSKFKIYPRILTQKEITALYKEI